MGAQQIQITFEVYVFCILHCSFTQPIPWALNKPEEAYLLSNPFQAGSYIQSAPLAADSLRCFQFCRLFSIQIKFRGHAPG